LHLRVSYEVRSLTLDTWSESRLGLLRDAGNARANTWWEATVDLATGRALSGDGSGRRPMTKPAANPTRAEAEVRTRYFL
jgi:hypothetical protein